jgi:hypothetical protein
MDNLARKEDVDQRIRQTMADIARIGDPKRMMELADSLVYSMPPERGVEMAGLMSYANPFYLPEMPDEAAERIAIHIGTLAEYVMRAKLTANRAGKRNILLACAPKSASTFIQGALRAALDLPTASLFTATTDPMSGSALGANLREQEPDELALLRAGLNGRGYVTQHHARCSPYLARLVEIYRIRPIVTYRNIFDTLVSMDDMVVEWRKGLPVTVSNFFNDAMPQNYHLRDREARLMMLARRWAPWLTQFYVSWRKSEALGFVKPLWISYDADFLGDKSALAARIVDYVGASGDAALRLTAAFEDRSDASAKRLNKGVAGRGRDIPDAVRAHVMAVASAYADDVDLAPLVGG